MKMFLQKYHILQQLAIAFVILSCVFQALAIPFAMEEGSNYFVPSPLPVLATICMWAAIVTGVASVFTTKRERLNKDIFRGHRKFLVSTTLGFLLCALTALMRVVEGILANGALSLDLSFFIFVFSLTATVYIILLCRPTFRENPGRVQIVALLGFGAVIACVLLGAYYYFDMTVELNAPIKTMLQAALLFSTLFFTGELRYLLKRPMPRLFLILCNLTVAIGARPAVFILISFFYGVSTRLDYAAGGLLILSIVCTALIRIENLFTSEEEPAAEEPNNEDSVKDDIYNMEENLLQNAPESNEQEPNNEC